MRRMKSSRFDFVHQISSPGLLEPDREDFHPAQVSESAHRPARHPLPVGTFYLGNDTAQLELSLRPSPPNPHRNLNTNLLRTRASPTPVMKPLQLLSIGFAALTITTGAVQFLGTEHWTWPSDKVIGAY